MHAPFEGPGNIWEWAAARGHDFRIGRLYAGEPLPGVPDLDLLVVMGGPMSVHDETEYPWLVAEKKLIRRCLASGKFVLGVCLGSQLLAEALGARVYRNRLKEIGWFPVEQQTGVNNSHLLRTLPRQFIAFHWHGETYDLPPGTNHLASTEACPIQAFEHPFGLGLQFHLEMTPNGVSDLVHECVGDIGTGPFEQTSEQMLACTEQYPVCGKLLAEVLDNIQARIEQSSRFGI
jgi:GMP synthase (glutamine-hydrolysing)